MIDNYEDELQDDEVHEKLTRWITFNLGEELYGIEVQQVREILRVNEILPVPGAPHFILGITNIRGSVVTVVDGRSRINLQPVDYTDSTRMIVIESNDDVIAVVVDNVADIIDLPGTAIDLNPKLKTYQESRYVDGVVSYPDGLIIILNAEKFITDDQYAMAAGF